MKIKALVLAIVLSIALVGCAKQAEEPKDLIFDTTALESWCRGDNTTVRMVGAWRHDDQTLEDENHVLYWIGDLPVAEDDFCLLWVDEGNNVIKVWVEAHE